MTLRLGGDDGIDKGLEKTKRGWFSRVARLFTEPWIPPELWEDLEEALIGADVGLDLSEELVNRTRDRIRAEGLDRSAQVKDVLKAEMVRVMRSSKTALPIRTSVADSGGLEIMLVVGVNGSGKTTTIAKLARRRVAAGERVLLAAADTFRAAAVEQLQVWGNRLGVEVIAHQQGADPGAVAFDGVNAARARGVDVLIIDTAGRLHTKTNLMEELKKIRRVIERAIPDPRITVLLVLDATTGQNGLAQAKEFARVIDVDALVLSKLDGSSKGGVVLAVTRELGLPIAFVGTGEGVDDLAPFDPTTFVNALVD